MRIRDLSAEDIALAGAAGWLARQPEAFRTEMLRHCLAQVYEPGEAIYHLGDPPGGIFGLVSGLMTVTAAPGTAGPRLIHVGTPGTWTGEGCYLSGEPRRIELRAATAARLLHLPLDAMEQMTARDARAARSFGHISLFNIDVLLRVIHDLLIRDPDHRVAAVLLRLGASGLTLPLTQGELGAMACVTRKQANLALGRLTAAGWVEQGYRSVTLRDPEALRAFLSPADEG